MIINGDCLEELKNLPDDSVDSVISDPPYGLKFMQKMWDIDVPSVEIWQECLRVLKPGGWCMVMSAPRSDVQNAMISRLMEAGFRLDFTPIYWTYASGFPKAGNVGKLVDKRLGAERTSTGELMPGHSEGRNRTFGKNGDIYGDVAESKAYVTEPATDQAKALDGSYTGFQPKPAVEVIIVAMKPLSEKTYVDQALKNGKGITWLGDCRVPTGENLNGGAYSGGQRGEGDWKDGSGFKNDNLTEFTQPQGRFPANLLVSDDVLNDGVVTKSGKSKANTYEKHGGQWGQGKQIRGADFSDSGSYSRYFDLDKWAAAHLSEQQMKTFPFAIFPKASKSEKNKGLDALQDRQGTNPANQRCSICGYVRVQNQPGRNSCTCAEPNFERSFATTKNHHPTVKPLKLMSYLITLTTREGDTVLDPFVGSGTTVVAANSLNRKGIGIEREEEYAEIARARVEATEKVESEDDNQLQLV